MVKTIAEPTLFTWIVPPTVIYGRHQSAEVEVNEAYCRAHGIAVVQRKSGGGCVYADEGNLMIAYHAETGLKETLRCDGIRRVHFRPDGTPYFGMSASEDLTRASVASAVIVG